jgi:inner membrane protein
MRTYTHIAGAVLFFLIFSYLLDIPNLLLGFFFVVWISVFPDIMDRLVGKHRGIGHSIFWLIPMAMGGFLSMGISAALIIGFISHIFLDIFTVKGCPLLYPLRKTSFVCLNRQKRIKTGTNQDKSVFIFLIFLIIPLIFFTTFAGSILSFAHAQNFSFPGNNLNSSPARDSFGNGISLNFNLDKATNKNVTVERVNENITNIIIRDLEPGGLKNL